MFRIFFRKIEIVNPKVIILFGNQVSSIVLNKKITVSSCHKGAFRRKISDREYTFYSARNGRFNVDKSIEDIKSIY